MSAEEREGLSSVADPEADLISDQPTNDVIRREGIFGPVFSVPVFESDEHKPRIETRHIDEQQTSTTQQHHLSSSSILCTTRAFHTSASCPLQ